MVVLVAIVLGLVLGGRALFGAAPDSGHRSTVDYRATFEQVRKVAPFDVVAPPSLPDGWRATSATYDSGPKGRWHLGVVTDGKEYVGLEQTPLGVPTVVERFAADTRPKGKTSIDGNTWRVRAGADSETTLVRRAGGVTTLVTGTAPRKQLESYAASLSNS